MRVKRLDPRAILPKRATPGSAGLDIATIEDFRLHPTERRMVRTGLAFELDHGFEVQLRPRSGLAIKHGITLINAPATIDADYKGEVCVLLVNLGNIYVDFKTGDRIAQAVHAPVLMSDVVETNEVTESARGAGGFGHSDGSGPK